MPINKNSKRPVVSVNYQLRADGTKYGDITKCTKDFVTSTEAIDFLNHVKEQIDMVINDIKTLKD